MSDKNEPVKPAAGSGNASNPDPQEKSGTTGKGLLDPKAEKYIRESGNIEDLPDAQEDREAIEKMEKEKKENKENRNE